MTQHPPLKTKNYLSAASLYVVLIVALLIAVISSSLIAVAYVYRLEFQKHERFDRLSANLSSGIALLLARGDSLKPQTEILDLYDEAQDSIILEKRQWGVYTLNAVRAFYLADTLKKAFLSGDSLADPSAIYLADEDRPLSVSGKTRIAGQGELPKSGIKPAYVDGKAYEGRELISGRIVNSKRTLPPLSRGLIDSLVALLDIRDQASETPASARRSFLEPMKVISLGKGTPKLEGINLEGNILIRSDTTLVIAANVLLNDVQVIAPSIVLEEGFRGRCQLFARDSITIGRNSRLEYPSAAVVIRADTAKTQPKISLGQGSIFRGVLCSYEKQRSALQTTVILARESMVHGLVYASGFVRLERTATVFGKVACNRFIMRSPSTLYENYLIDITFDRKRLHPDYLAPALFGTGGEHKVLKWMD